MPAFESNLAPAVTALSLLLLGCNNKPETPGDLTQRPSQGIPKGALLLAEQPGRMMLQAPGAGVAYIKDQETGKVIYTSAVKRGDALIFWPERDQILLNGAVVQKDSPLNEKHVHRLYFLKG
jgi:hypothetical protein